MMCVGDDDVDVCDLVCEEMMSVGCVLSCVFVVGGGCVGVYFVCVF